MVLSLPRMKGISGVRAHRRKARVIAKDMKTDRRPDRHANRASLDPANA